MYRWTAAGGEHYRHGGFCLMIRLGQGSLLSVNGLKIRSLWLIEVGSDKEEP